MILFNGFSQVATTENYIYRGHRTDEVNIHFLTAKLYEWELYLQRPSNEVNIYFPTSKLLNMRFIFTEAIWRGEYPFFYIDTFDILVHDDFEGFS